jgi:hypothetical protein
MSLVDRAYAPRDFDAGLQSCDKDTGVPIPGVLPPNVTVEMLQDMLETNPDTIDVINSVQPGTGSLQHLTCPLNTSGSKAFFDAGVGKKRPNKNNSVTVAVTGVVHFASTGGQGNTHAVRAGRPVEMEKVQSL